MQGLNTELFSALLEAAPENPSRGAGGTAIVTASSSAPSIHLSVVFSGAFSPDDVADVPISVRLASEKHVVLDEVVRVHKPSHVSVHCLLQAFKSPTSLFFMHLFRCKYE